MPVERELAVSILFVLCCMILYNAFQLDACTLSSRCRRVNDLGDGGSLLDGIGNLRQYVENKSTNVHNNSTRCYGATVASMGAASCGANLEQTLPGNKFFYGSLATVTHLYNVSSFWCEWLKETGFMLPHFRHGIER